MTRTNYPKHFTSILKFCNHLLILMSLQIVFHVGTQNEKFERMFTLRFCHNESIQWPGSVQFNLKLFIFIQLIFIQLNFVFQYIVVLRFFDQNSYFYTNNYFNSMKRERNWCVCQHDLTIYSANELFQRLHFNLNPRLGKCVVVLIEKNKGSI